MHTLILPTNLLPVVLTGVLLTGCVTTAPPLEIDTAAQETTPPCETRVVSTSPADGAVGVWLVPALEVQLDPPDPTAGLVLLGSEDEPVKGAAAVEDEGALWRFNLEEALAPGQEFVLQVDSCAGSSEVGFTTVDDPGLPPELAKQAVAYHLDLSYGRLVSPRGLDDALQPLWPQHPWLLGAAYDSGVSDSLTLEIGASVGPAQDTCVVTHALPTASLNETHITAGPKLSAIELEVGLLTLYDLTLSATFNHDGGELAGLELSTLIDARDLAGLGLLGDTSDEVCAALALDDVACEDCGDGVIACVSARWDSIVAPIVDGVSLQEIPSANCHPDCAASFTNPLCNTTGW